MKQDWYRVVGWILVAIAGACGVGAALHLLVTLPLGEKGPDWIVAFGTIGTLTGTIWLATAETRRREREERTLAKLQGKNMISRIMRAQNIANRCLSVANTARQTRTLLSHAQVQDLFNSFALLEVWDARDLMPLASLPNDMAFKLASAGGGLTSARHFLDDFARGYPNTPQDQLAMLPFILTGTLKGASEILGQAIDALGVTDLPPEDFEKVFGPRS